MIILIGGTSNVGKSTVAEQLAYELGIAVISTDSLAKHPGRPWKKAPQQIPEHVRVHYLKLSHETLIHSVLTHYENLQSEIRSIINLHLSNHASIILEGSAVLPSLVQEFNNLNVIAFLLVANENFLSKRIKNSSNYFRKSTEEKLLIDKFLVRSILFNDIVAERVADSNLKIVDVEKFESSKETVEELKRFIVNSSTPRQSEG